MQLGHVTMQQVARSAGVSRTTVSFVLNGKADEHGIAASTQARVLAAARALGYGTGIQRANGSTVALAIRSPLDKVNQAAFLVELMGGLAEVLEARGYGLQLVEVASEASRNYPEWLRRGGFAAVVLNNLLTSDRDALDALARSPIPAVSIHSSSMHAIPGVDVDNEDAATRVVQYLIGLGHQRIAMIAYCSRDHLTSLHRFAGYRRALAGAGLPFDDALVEEADFTIESGADAFLRLVDGLSHAPTAVFASSDVVAVGVMAAAKQRGLRIPDDLSIVGFDDVPMTQYLTPSLSTVRRNGHEIGSLAANTLLERMSGRSGVPTSRPQAELVIRDSASRPRRRNSLVARGVT